MRRRRRATERAEEKLGERKKTETMALRPRYTSNMAAEGRIGGGQPRYRRRRDARASLTSPQTQRSSFLSAPTALLRLKRSPPTLLCSPPLAVHSLPFYFMLRVSLSPFLSLFLPLFLSFRLSHRYPPRSTRLVEASCPFPLRDLLRRHHSLHCHPRCTIRYIVHIRYTRTRLTCTVNRCKLVDDTDNRVGRLPTRLKTVKQGRW